MEKILVIDDERSTLHFLRSVLTSQGWRVETAMTPERASELTADDRFDLVISDINLKSARNGLDLLREVRDRSPVILITGDGSLETAVEASREGARDIVAKPFNIDEIISTVRRVLTDNGRNEDEGANDEAVVGRLSEIGLLGHSPAMLLLYKKIARVACAPSTVLICGESGTGKELVARALHKYSREREPFIPVNCGALTETLLEAELFGHVRGAFTGAVSDRRGLWEEAGGGTLFLDEIGETSPAMQVKLLRALQENEIRRVGASRPIKVRARVVAATNRNLEEEVRNGRFREDLYYRLNVICLQIPALCERRSDIPLLAETFLRRVSQMIGRNLKFSVEALKLIVAADWPGNVRELEAAIEQAALNAICNKINPEDLPDKLQSEEARVRAAAARSPMADLYADFPSLDELERRYLIYLLDALGGSRTRAAEILRVNRRTLYRMADRFGISLDGE